MSDVASSPIWTEGASIDIPRLPEEETPPRFSVFNVGAATFAAVVLIASVLTWNWSYSIHGPNAPIGFERFARNTTPTESEVARLLDASDENDFFGVPIDIGNTGIVFDDRNRLEGYADDLAQLAYAASVFDPTGGPSLGAIVEARLKSSSDTSERDPFYALNVARVRSQKKRIGEGETVDSYLSAAIELVRASSPDQICVVIAEPLSDVTRQELGDAIRAVRVPVHIIALGEAAKASYGSLAAINGGAYIPVNDAVFERLVGRCDIELPARP